LAVFGPESIKRISNCRGEERAPQPPPSTADAPESGRLPKRESTLSGSEQARTVPVVPKVEGARRFGTGVSGEERSGSPLVRRSVIKIIQE